MRIDRLDTDRLQRIRETDVWQEYEKRIRERHSYAVRSCLNADLDEKAIRKAQGAAEALAFVLALPDTIQKEVVRRNADGTATAGS